MGIKSSSARLLAYLKRQGETDLRSVCMLGRQELCLTKRQIRAFGKDYSDVLQSGFKQEIYSENFLKALGAEQIHSLDASDFVGKPVSDTRNLFHIVKYRIYISFAFRHSDLARKESILILKLI